MISKYSPLIGLVLSWRACDCSSNEQYLFLIKKQFFQAKISDLYIAWSEIRGLCTGMRISFLSVQHAGS